MIKWLKEKGIFAFIFNAIIIKLSELKMVQGDRELLLIQPLKIIFRDNVLIKVAILKELKISPNMSLLIIIKNSISLIQQVKANILVHTVLLSVEIEEININTIVRHSNYKDMSQK